MCVCAKSLQSCPTLCDPVDYSPAGSSVQGILQARILEWVPRPPPGDLPDPGIEPTSPVSRAWTGGLLTAVHLGSPSPLFFNPSQKCSVAFSVLVFKIFWQICPFHIFYFIWYLNILIFYCLFLVFKNISAFSMLTLYSITFLNLFILIELGDTDFIGASTLTIMLSANKNNLTAFLIWTILNENGDIRYPCSILALRGKLFSLPPLTMSLTTGSLQMLLSACEVPFYLFAINPKAVSHRIYTCK